MPYAENTLVSAEKSRAEIETTLKRYGADSFGYMTDKDKAMVGFRCKDRTIRLIVKMPQTSEMPKCQRWRGWTDNQKVTWVEQEYRRRWRCLTLVIKAKLEAVQSGIALFEDEFLPYTITASGETVAEVLRPQLAEICKQTAMPMLAQQT